MCQTSTDGRSMRYSGVRTTVVAAQSSGAVIGYTIFFRHENAVTLQRGRRGLAGVGVGVGRAVLKLPCTKFGFV